MAENGKVNHFVMWRNIKIKKGNNNKMIHNPNYEAKGENGYFILVNTKQYLLLNIPRLL
jgi:hypothetical protein